MSICDCCKSKAVVFRRESPATSTTVAFGVKPKAWNICEFCEKIPHDDWVLRRPDDLIVISAMLNHLVSQLPMACPKCNGGVLCGCQRVEVQ